MLPDLSIRLVPPFPANGSNGGVSTADASDNTWGIEATGVANSRFDGSGVKVAVLDTGIVEHPAFDGLNILKKDFTDEGIEDLDGHGTHCAGTIAGQRILGQPRFGVAPNIDQLLVAKVIPSDGGGSSLALVQAIQWAMQNGADIISMSLGFDLPGAVEGMIADGWPADLAASRALQTYQANVEAFAALANAGFAMAGVGAGSLIVAAAGNESKREINDDYVIGVAPPAAAPGVLSVGAIGSTGSSSTNFTVAPFSNTSPNLSAPGVDILSAWIGGGMESISGTSMATPHVAGIAALWMQQLREQIGIVTPDTIKNMLMGRARNDVFQGGWSAVDVGLGLAIAP
ncbi:S8 family serine peptidase [Lewinella sp. W8]|uniref:S8 family serine peptidase n=1 Tax=Lewinella sp. W8 TaxID=2528208 RepID=UPI001567AB50